MKPIRSLFILLSSIFFTVAQADKIAIIGGGGAGLVSAWLLEQDHQVTLYEARDRLGGHADTIDVDIDDEKAIIEVGTEFFNKTSYIHFFKLLRYLDIPLKSFTLVTNFYHTDKDEQLILPPYHDGNIEWESFSPSNIYRMLNLKKLVNRAHHLIEKKDFDTTLGEFIAPMDFSHNISHHFLTPFFASGWGVSPEEITDFSAYNTLKYVVEGNDSGDYKWYEVKNGLRQYIQTVRDSLHSAIIHLSSPVVEITRENEQYLIKTAGGNIEQFDQVILANNANISGQLLSQLPDQADVSALLATVRYFDTQIAIHGDKRFMPKKKDDWRVVNIRYDGKMSATTMYKSWKSKSPIFKTWVTHDVRSSEDTGPVMPEPLYALVHYRHAATDKSYYRVQKEIAKVQGDRNIWFAGSWTQDNDSHESAIVSAIKIAQRLSPESERLKAIN